MATREQTIAGLIESRNSLHHDLTTCGKHKVDTEWWTDRVREMEYINRTLERMGAIPSVAG